MQISDAQNCLSPDFIDQNLQQEIVSFVQKCFGDDTLIISIDVLTEPSHRNQVMRLNLKSSTNQVPSSVILKRSIFKESIENESQTLGRFARDWAGLEFLNNLGCDITPKFYGGHQKYQFILLEDLGQEHLSLVDSLMGHDREQAMQSLTRYMYSLGKFHGYTFGRVSSHEEILRKVNPVISYRDSYYDKLLNQLKISLEKIDVCFSDNLQREIEQVWKICRGPGPFTVLLHGDICPDNVVDQSDLNKMHIIDFEWSFVGNALLDATYLRMSMPTCWCVKAFPQEIIGLLELIYRRQLMTKIPAASDDQLYHQSYIAACAYWVLNQITQIDDVLENDLHLSDSVHPLPHPKWREEDRKRRPRTLTRLKSFLDIDQVDQQWPYFKNVIEEIIIKLDKKWAGIEPLEFYPAFNRAND